MSKESTIINIENTKTLTEMFPDIDFYKSYNDINRIISLEDTCEQYFDKRFHDYSVIWQYGFHYITSLFDYYLKVHKSYMPLVAYFTETHSALRASFTISLYGYSSEAIAILRKAFESLIKAGCSKANPQNFENIMKAKSTSKLEHKLGLDLKSISNVTSTFVHSNNLKIISSVIQYHFDIEQKEPITYGPQKNEKGFLYAACLSIFLIYIFVRFAPKVFPNQIDNIWLEKSDSCEKLMRYYLDFRKSGFFDDCNQIDLCLDKIHKDS